jgi:hypothetical protein
MIGSPQQYTARSKIHEAPDYPIFTVSCYFLPLGPKYLPQYLISKTINLCPSFGVRDQFSYPYITAGKIIILYTLFNFYALEKKEGNKI